MFKKMASVLFSSALCFAEFGFNCDSLVFTEESKMVELIAHHNESSMKFARDLDDAISQAELDNKTIVLIVVGSSNCPWSEKLLFDVVYQPEFNKFTSKKHIICKVTVDQLKRGGLEIGLSKHIETVPAFFLLNSHGLVISQKEDLPESPKEAIGYISDVLKMHRLIDESLKLNQPIKDDLLEEYYLKSKNLGLVLEEKLYNLGIAKKKNIFFKLERYSKMLGSASHKEIKDLKLEIQLLDPKNIKGSSRRMAIMEFEHRSHQKKGMENPFSALKPLFEYLRDYGHYDKEHRWEIEMKIARFLFSKNQLQAAIQHASRSLEFSPEEHKKEVEDAINFLKSQKKN